MQILTPLQDRKIMLDEVKKKVLLGHVETEPKKGLVKCQGDAARTPVFHDTTLTSQKVD